MHFYIPEYLKCIFNQLILFIDLLILCSKLTGVFMSSKMNDNDNEEKLDVSE